jgi:hypothetical protein
MAHDDHKTGPPVQPLQVRCHDCNIPPAATGQPAHAFTHNSTQDTHTHTTLDFTKTQRHIPSSRWGCWPHRRSGAAPHEDTPTAHSTRAHNSTCTRVRHETKTDANRGAALCICRVPVNAGCAGMQGPPRIYGRPNLGLHTTRHSMAFSSAQACKYDPSAGSDAPGWQALADR